MKFELNGEFIRLGDLLKAAGLTGTGGEAKQAVQDGLVNGCLLYTSDAADE